MRGGGRSLSAELQAAFCVLNEARGPSGLPALCRRHRRRDGPGSARPGLLAAGPQAVRERGQPLVPAGAERVGGADLPERVAAGGGHVLRRAPRAPGPDGGGTSAAVRAPLQRPRAERFLRTRTRARTRTRTRAGSGGQSGARPERRRSVLKLSVPDARRHREVILHSLPSLRRYFPFLLSSGGTSCQGGCFRRPPSSSVCSRQNLQRWLLQQLQSAAPARGLRTATARPWSSALR